MTMARRLPAIALILHAVVAVASAQGFDLSSLANIDPNKLLGANIDPNKLLHAISEINPTPAQVDELLKPVSGHLAPVKAPDAPKQVDSDNSADAPSPPRKHGHHKHAEAPSPGQSNIPAPHGHHKHAEAHAEAPSPGQSAHVPHGHHRHAEAPSAPSPGQSAHVRHGHHKHAEAPSSGQSAQPGTTTSPNTQTKHAEAPSPGQSANPSKVEAPSPMHSAQPGKNPIAALIDKLPPIPVNADTLETLAHAQGLLETMSKHGEAPAPGQSADQSSNIPQILSEGSSLLKAMSETPISSPTEESSSSITRTRSMTVASVAIVAGYFFLF